MSAGNIHRGTTEKYIHWFNSIDYFVDSFFYILQTIFVYFVDIFSEISQTQISKWMDSRHLLNIIWIFLFFCFRWRRKEKSTVHLSSLIKCSKNARMFSLPIPSNDMVAIIAMSKTMTAAYHDLSPLRLNIGPNPLFSSLLILPLIVFSCSSMWYRREKLIRQITWTQSRFFDHTISTELKYNMEKHEILKKKHSTPTK